MVLFIIKQDMSKISVHMTRENELHSSLHMIMTMNDDDNEKKENEGCDDDDDDDIGD